MSDDIIKWLRERVAFERNGGITWFRIDNIVALVDRLDAAERENERLREALLPFVDEGIELNCDECGGDQNKCNASCVVRKGRAVLDAAMAAEQSERREG